MLEKNAYYKILNVKKDAAPEQIDAAYQKQKAAYQEATGDHDEEVLLLLEEAHQILSDENLRRSYDEEQAKRPISMEELNEKVDKDARKMGRKNNIYLLMEDFVTTDPEGEEHLAWEFFAPILLGLLFLLALGRYQ